MLRGHETLTRLVGKRLRLDSAFYDSFIDSTTPDENRLECSLEPLSRVNEMVPSEGMGWQTMEDIVLPSSLNRTSEDSGSTWVKCPVCGRDVKGDDHYINIHLDLCLLEKPKSKFNQLTLSQFAKVSFQGKMKTFDNDKENVTVSKKMKVEATTMPFRIARSVTVSNGYQNENPINVKHDVLERLEDKHIFAIDQCICVCHLKTDAFNILQIKKCDGSSSHLQEENLLKLYKEPIKAELLDHVYDHRQDDKLSELCEKSTKATEFQSNCGNKELYILETAIVGRKFNQQAKIEVNMVISAIREPDNPIDQNAIKIVRSDNQGNPTLGHLPRTIASLFSCLLDRFLLNIQGIILKVPEKASEPVPVKLQFERQRDLECTKEDSECFEQSWQKIQEIVEVSNGKDNSIKYLHNFTYILKAVLERDSHLFSEEEIMFLESFFSLSENARCLFVRLSQRKGPWFRVSLVSYPEIPNIKQSCIELLETFEEDCPAKAIRERIQVLNVPELKQLLLQITSQMKKPGDLSKMKREELLDFIVIAAKDSHQSKLTGTSSCEPTVALILQMVGFCVRLSDRASFLIWRIQRLFFLNGEQDLSAFLLADMGATKYPSYVCNRTRGVFMTRKDLLSYEEALKVAQAMDMAIENDDHQTIEHCVSRSCIQLRSNEADQMSIGEYSRGDIFLECFTAGWVYTTILTLGVSVLERDRRYSEAIGLLRNLLSRSLCPGRRGYWTTRLSIDLEHVGCKEESLEVAESALNDSRICNGDRIALQRRVIRLAKPPRRWKKPSFANSLSRSCKEVFITGRPLNSKAGVKSRFYSYDDQQCGVEELALQYYAGVAGGSWQGIHSESGIWMTLFALLMWDVLFMDVPNVFWHPFQNAPLDLNTDAFYPRREPMIKEQLRRIRCGEAPQLLASTWSKHFGRVCRGLNWERQSLEELQVIVSCIGGCGLASICKVLAEDYSGLASGMPDLLLWRVTSSNMSSSCCKCKEHDATSTQLIGKAKLVEVKGPRDCLSEQQHAWIYILMDAGIEVEVCKVLDQPISSKGSS